MRPTRGRRMALGLGALVAAAAVLAAQPAAQTDRATIDADQLEYDIDSGQAVLTGNCLVSIEGRVTGTLRASKVAVNIDTAANKIDNLEATGPVTFDGITDRVQGGAGKRVQVVGSCRDRATFSEKTMILSLIGAAHLATVTMPQDQDVKRAQFDGQTISYDLDANRVRGTKVRIQMEIATKERAPAP